MKNILTVAILLFSINSLAAQTNRSELISEGNNTIVCGISVDFVSTTNPNTDTYRLKDSYEQIGATVTVCKYGNGYAVVAKLPNGRIEALLNLNIR